MTLRYAETALREVDDILAYIARDNPPAAAAVGVAIKAAATRLRSFPHIGAETDQAGAYMKIVRPFRYLIFYTIDGDWIVIRNVRHAARRRPPA
jgi:toxin ParE1/3/4